MYDHVGALDFVDNTVGGNTDTMILRGVIANPRLTRFRGGIRALGTIASLGRIAPFSGGYLTAGTGGPFCTAAEARAWS